MWLKDLNSHKRPPTQPNFWVFWHFENTHLIQTLLCCAKNLFQLKLTLPFSSPFQSLPFLLISSVTASFIQSYLCTKLAAPQKWCRVWQNRKGGSRQNLNISCHRRHLPLKGMLRSIVNANMSTLTTYDQMTKNILISGNRSIKVNTPNGTAKNIQEHPTAETDSEFLCVLLWHQQLLSLLSLC